MVEVSQTCDLWNVLDVLESMAMGKRQAKQQGLWVSTSEIPKAASHPFYAKVNEVLEQRKLDRRLEHLCRRFNKPVWGRPSMAPGVYFRLLLIGFFEGDRFRARKSRGAWRTLYRCASLWASA